MLSKIPQTTTPLTKFIRTTEGIVLVVFNLTLLIVPIVTNFPGVQAAKWAGIVNTAAIISRSGLKAVAVFAQNTGLQPIEPSGVPAVLDGMPTDNTSATASMDTVPQSGVTPDPGMPVEEPSTDVPPPPAAPSGGTGTGPLPGTRVPGAQARRQR